MKWHLAAKLLSGEMLIGLILISGKTAHNPFSQTDLRVLKMVTQWAAHVLRVHELTRLQMEEELETTDLLMNAEAELREDIAADLHDKVITTLAWARHMLEVGRDANRS